MKTSPNLNGYHIFWGLSIDKNNIINTEKNVFAGDKERLLEKMRLKRGRFFIITDKQFGLIQINYNPDVKSIPNTKLSIHLEVKTKNSKIPWMIPMTKLQFENPVEF